MKAIPTRLQIHHFHRPPKPQRVSYTSYPNIWEANLPSQTYGIRLHNLIQTRQNQCCHWCSLSPFRLNLRYTSLSLSLPHFTFLEQLKLALAASNQFTTMYNQISQQPSMFLKYKIDQGLIIYDNRIWLNPSNPFCNTLLTEFHSSLLAGHMGFAKTLARLQANFWWKGMRDQVKQFVKTCLICQQVKYETKKTPDLLQPLLIPQAIWEDLSLNFITSLPLSKGHNVILVVVDRLFKWVHLVALSPNFTAHKVAFVFLYCL